MPEKKPYNDFCLVEATHLNRQDFGLLGKERFSQEIAARLDFAKEQIMAETKPGDLILLERADGTSYKQWCKALGLADNPKNRADWRNIVEPVRNFYHKLAVFAERHGRRAMSLESGLIGEGSKFSKMTKDMNSLPNATQERLGNVLYNRRNSLFASRIEHRKPKMVIVADSHAFFLYGTLSPKIARWFRKPSASDFLLKQEFAKIARRVQTRKKVRLAKARMRIRARPK